MPKISVVMPAYNAEKYIAEAIESILNQTYSDFEFIIINDGSIDKTEEIILSYNDERIVYIKNEKNMGIVYTLNRGLDTAKGKYIARMDSDDISMPKRFEKQLKYMEKHKNIAVLGTAVYIFGNDIETHIFNVSTIPSFKKAELFFSSSLGHPTVMIRKSVLNDYNLCYEEKYNGLEDYVLWWKIAQHGDIGSLAEPLLKYRKHPTQITASNNLAFQKKMEIFLLERISKFSISYTDDEFAALLKYCLSNYDQIVPLDIKNLDSLFKKLLNKNKKIKYFNQYYFKKVLSLAILYSISLLNTSETKKQKQRYYAFKSGVLSTELFLKVLVRKFFKK